MPKVYSEFHIQDVGLGINRFHTLDKIPDGFMYSLKNMDALSNGQTVTRKGYEQYYGCLPLRANSITKVDTLYTLTFDNSSTIDLGNSKVGPIIVSGDIDSASGCGTSEDFGTAFQTHYYDTYNLPVRETFSPGTPATHTKTAAQTGVSQDKMFVGWYQSDSGENLSNTLLVPDDIQITQSNYEVNMDYTFSALSSTWDDSDVNTDAVDEIGHGFVTGNSVIFTEGTAPIGGLTDGTTYYIIYVDDDRYRLATSSANATAGTFITLTPGSATGHNIAQPGITGFYAYLETPAVVGTVHIETFSPAQTDWSVSAATHALKNDNFIIRCYSDVGGVYTEVVPQTITVDGSSNIAITMGAATEGIVIIYAADNLETTEALAGPGTLTISNVTTPFNIYEIWITSGVTKTLVAPAYVTWDSDAQEVTMGYIAGASDENVEVNWVEADYVSNTLTFTGSDTGTDFTSSSPEITVWGLCHDGLYNSSFPKGGFTHHLDNYKSENTEKMVTALGGNLMQATSYSTGATTYKMPSLTLRGSNRVLGAQILAPLFTATDVSRTRGSAYDDDNSAALVVNGAGYAPISSVEYDPGSGKVDYTFSFTNLTNGASIASYVSDSDYLTVQNCGRDVNNGSFKIVGVQGTPSTTSVVIRVTNSAVTSDIFDETAISARGNVFTDQLELTETPIFATGDTISSTSTNDNTVKTVDVSSNNYIYIDGITATLSVPDGQNLYAQRTSPLLSLQAFPDESVGNDTAGGFVNGDSITIDGVTQSPKVTYINTNATAAASVSVASLVATITLTAHGLNTGQTVRFTASSDADFEGEYVIASVPTADTFTVATTAADGTPTATLTGKTIEVDESLDLTTGPTQIVVRPQGRWTVVEMPKSTQSRVLETKTQHFDESSYTGQPYTKSVIVNDSMFLINDTDEVKKFDGSTLSNAGLPPFQGWFFASVDSGTQSLESAATVDWNNGTVAGDDPASKQYFIIDTPLLRVADRFKATPTDAAGDVIYTVSSIEKRDSEEYAVYTEETIVAASNDTTGVLTRANVYRYYVRYNAIDSNRNTLASAALGSDDMYVETYTKSAIDLKFAGMPPFAELDHDKIEIEIYRTKRFAPTEFFRIHRRSIDYSDLGGYISYTDTNLDEVLSSALWDDPMHTLLAPEIGNQWTSPPLADSITTVDNRLVLANIKSPPILDVAFVSKGSVLESTAFSSGEVQVQLSTAVTGSETFNDSIVFSFEDTSTALIPASDIGIGADGDFHNWHDSAVTVTDTITSAGHGLTSGIRVTFTQGTGTLGDLVDGTVYYASFVDSDNYKLCTTLANVFSATFVSIPTGGLKTDHATTVQGNHIVIDSVFTGTSAGDWLYLFHQTPAENNTLDLSGWHRITETTGNSAAIIDLAHGLSTGAAATTDVDKMVLSTSSTFNSTERVPVWLGVDGNINQLYSELASMETKVTTRLSMAISAIMSADPPSNTYWTTSGLRPTPWLLAQGGQSFNTGEMRIQLVDNPSGIANFQWSGIDSTLVEIYINNNSLATGTDAPSQIRLFNSRLAISYPNFPEIFDNPYEDAGYSDSVIDVNPADGQEITAIIPFFGKSTFGSANLTQYVVVFKTNSIYVVDVRTGGTQRLQTAGKGCTAPRSVALTKDGVMFCNESGIYRLGWDMQVSWVGRMLNRLWKDDLDLDDIAEYAGHNYNQNQQYKLSVVTSSSNYPDNVLVYDHTREEVGQMGSWSEYTNHAATGWSNQSKDAFFGSQSGTVFKVRNSGEMSDYRDDASAIAEQSLITGGIHYGLPGNRKTTNGLTIQYQNDSTLTDINVLTEQSLSGTFNASTQVDLSGNNQTVRYSLTERKGTAIRVKLTKSGTKDEQLQLSRLTFHTKDAGTGAVQQAAQTT